MLQPTPLSGEEKERGRKGKKRKKRMIQFIYRKRNSGKERRRIFLPSPFPLLPLFFYIIKLGKNMCIGKRKKKGGEGERFPFSSLGLVLA